MRLVYDPNDNLDTLDNGLARRDLDYDENDNLRSESLTVGGLALSAIYDYNNRDQLKSITYPSTAVVDYTPDALGRPTTALPHAAVVTHHPNGVVKRIKHANGQVTTTTLNNRQWLKSTLTAPVGGRVVSS